MPRRGGRADRRSIAMGQTSSLSGLEPLRRLSGAEPVSHDDTALWDELFALSLPSQSAEELAAESFAFCAEMVRNNAQSGNLQALVRRLQRACETGVPCRRSFLVRAGGSVSAASQVEPTDRAAGCRHARGDGESSHISTYYVAQQEDDT